MFDSLVETITAYPYIGVGVLFLLCGMGLPLPEEIVLIAAGFVCFRFPDRAQVPWMMAACGGAILLGDLIPFVLGRVFGARLLRLRFMRILVTKRRLGKFDKWFRRRGDLVIFIARFLAGIRSVAFFTAGTLKMRWRRFLLLDGLGISLLVPPLVYAGFSGGEFINRVISRVQSLERNMLWAALGGGVVLLLFYWLRRRRRRRRRRMRPSDSYVEPRFPPREDLQGPPLPPEMQSAAGGAAPESSPDGSRSKASETAARPPAGPGSGSPQESLETPPEEAARAPDEET